MSGRRGEEVAFWAALFIVPGPVLGGLASVLAGLWLGLWPTVAIGVGIWLPVAFVMLVIDVLDRRAES